MSSIDSMQDLMIFEEYAGGKWTGINDHSVAISFAWDPGHFTIGVKVIDDTHQLSVGKSMGW